MGLVLRDPTAQPAIETVRLASRAADLRGKRLGLIKNGKTNSGDLLEEVYQILEPELEPAEVIRRIVPISVPAPDNQLDEIADECNLVILAVGD
jgi:hypothetical protein